MKPTLRHWATSTLLLLAAACTRPPTNASAEPAGPTRLPILDPGYGMHLEHGDAIAVGARFDALTLPLADGGEFELANANAAGPVVFAWIGGAEHESLVGWVRALDAALPIFDERGVTLVFVRPLDAEASLRWAVDLGLRSVVAGDPDAEFAGRLDLAELADLADPPTTIDFAVVIVGPDGLVAYRKLGGRRPELDELLAVINGEADGLRCCPGACVGPPCER